MLYYVALYIYMYACIYMLYCVAQHCVAPWCTVLQCAICRSPTHRLAHELQVLKEISPRHRQARFPAHKRIYILTHMTSLTNSSTCGKDHSLTRARTPDAEEVCAGHRQAQVYAHELMLTLAHRNSITNPCTCHAHELIYNSPANALTCESLTNSCTL